MKIIYYLLNHCLEIFFDNSDTNIALLHLKPKIKDISLSPFKLYSKKAHSFENLSEEEYRVFIQPISNKNIINQKKKKKNGTVANDTSKSVGIQFNKKHKVNQIWPFEACDWMHMPK